jgi:hypothetical protein
MAPGLFIEAQAPLPVPANIYNDVAGDPGLQGMCQQHGGLVRRIFVKSREDSLSA